MTAPEADPFFQTNRGPCQGRQESCTRDGCPVFGKLNRPSRDGLQRVRGCGDKVAQGKRNRRKGKQAQAKARKVLAIPITHQAQHGEEELWPGGVRAEAKTGHRVSPAITAFLFMEAQSEAARAVGDGRPFVGIATRDDFPDFLVTCRGSQLREVVWALAGHFGYLDNGSDIG